MKKYIPWLTLVLAISVVGGIAIDIEGFVVNLLASAVATVAGIWVAVVVIETILKQQRRQEWQDVKLRSYKALTQEIVSLAIQFNRLLTRTSYLSEILNMSSDVVSTHSQALDKLLDSLRNMDPIPTRPQIDSLYRRCSPHLHRIRDIILPLVVSMGQELQLIEVLQEFERAMNQWEIDQLTDVEQNISTERLFRDSLEVLMLLKELYTSFHIIKRS